MGTQRIPTNLSVKGDLSVLGSINQDYPTDLSVGGDLDVTGTSTLGDNTTVDGSLTATTLVGAGTLTTLTTSSTATITGDLLKAGTNGAALNLKVASTTHTCNSGTDTETFTSVIPAGVSVLGVVARVTTILAGASLSTWKLGTSGDDNLYGDTLALASGTTVNHATATANPTGAWSASAQSLIMKANAGVFSSGVVRLEVFYWDTTAPTS